MLLLEKTNKSLVGNCQFRFVIETLQDKLVVDWHNIPSDIFDSRNRSLSVSSIPEIESSNLTSQRDLWAWSMCFMTCSGHVELELMINQIKRLVYLS